MIPSTLQTVGFLCPYLSLRRLRIFTLAPIAFVNAVNSWVERHSHFVFTFCCSPRSQCCFLLLPATRPMESLLTAAHWSYPSANARWSQIRAPTFPIVTPSGTSYGAALSSSSHALGLRFIQTSPVKGSEKWKIVFKNWCGTQFYRLLSIASRYLYVHCSYPSTCWLGKLDNNWEFGE